MALPIILAVEDELDVLRDLERDLAKRYSADYQVLTSESPERGLELLAAAQREKTEVAIVIARIKLMAARSPRQNRIVHGVSWTSRMISASGLRTRTAANAMNTPVRRLLGSAGETSMCGSSALDVIVTMYVRSATPRGACRVDATAGPASWPKRDRQ